MTLVERLHRLEPAFRSEGRLIQLEASMRTVFVGDTHGDLDATERVLQRYVDDETVIVFLGDTVDRGPQSRENLDRILRAKEDLRDRMVLLMGNHEGWGAATFSPADFWAGLSAREERAVARGLLLLPFAAWHTGGLIATHGGLPDVSSLEGISGIVPGSAAWRDLVWGDWTEQVDPVSSSPGGRPTYGQETFEHRLDRLGLRVLVRSHQPSAPTYLYGDRCLTLFTSSAYGGTVRRVAVLAPSRRVTSARDLELAAL